jgi:rhodanese-related sulfurtransferase
MAKGKSRKHSNKGKSGSKASSNKARPVPGGTRSAASSTKHPVGSGKGKNTSTRAAFMRGARSRGGLGTWGLLGLLVVLVVFAVLYFTGALSTKLPVEVSVAEAYELYPDEAFFLDVREMVEYEFGNIPGTVNIPLGELAARVDELPSNQDIVVVCRSGNRSLQGRDTLLAAGFDNVTSMAGGVSDWKDAGYPYDGEVLR